MYKSITKDITVWVEPSYLPQESSPEENIHIWAYHVRIENNSDRTVQLKSRYWRITDAYGRVQEVSGAGVVGEEPVIEPGDVYEYTSGTPLNAPSGIMTGHYSMLDMDAPEKLFFDIEIPAFSLDSPHEKGTIN